MSDKPAKRDGEDPGFIVSTVAKLTELAREEVRYALPAVREAAAHATREFGKKFVAVYRRKKR